jgi:hypothetical protein
MMEWIMDFQDFVESQLGSFGSGFEVIRTHTADVTMPPTRIVERFDVV